MPIGVTSGTSRFASFAALALYAPRKPAMRAIAWTALRPFGESFATIVLPFLGQQLCDGLRGMVRQCAPGAQGHAHRLHRGQARARDRIACAAIVDAGLDAPSGAA